MLCSSLANGNYFSWHYVWNQNKDLDLILHFLKTFVFIYQHPDLLDSTTKKLPKMTSLKFQNFPWIFLILIGCYNPLQSTHPRFYCHYCLKKPMHYIAHSQGAINAVDYANEWQNCEKPISDTLSLFSVVSVNPKSILFLCVF